MTRQNVNQNPRAMIAARAADLAAEATRHLTSATVRATGARLPLSRRLTPNQSIPSKCLLVSQAICRCLSCLLTISNLLDTTCVAIDRGQASSSVKADLIFHLLCFNYLE